MVTFQTRTVHLYPVRVIADCEEDDFVLPIIVSPPVNVESYVEEVVVHQSRFPMEHFEMVLIIRPPAVDTHEDGVQGLCLPWGRRENRNTRELVAGDDIRQKLEFHHVHLELGTLGHIETFLSYWSWGFFQNNPPPRPIFVFENTRDLKNIFFKNRLKSFFYQSHWIAFVLTIPKWYNTWVLEIFFVNIFFKNIFQIFFKIFFQKIRSKIFLIPKC